MRSALAIGAAALSFNVTAALAAPPPAPDPSKTPTCETCTLSTAPVATIKPGTTAEAVNALETMSDGFWGDWKATQKSASFTALKAAMPSAAATAPATPATSVTPPGTQPAPAKQKIIDVAVTKPEAAAKLLTAASAAATDRETAKAMATIFTMTTTPKTLEAAAPLVAPAQQQQAQEMTANLSTGIAGLPGVYLSDAPIESSGGGGGGGGGRAEAPSGYTSVSGGSMGCPSN